MNFNTFADVFTFYLFRYYRKIMVVCLLLELLYFWNKKNDRK